MIREDVIIIGGGLAGLTVSYYLKMANKSSLVLERSNRLGGLCRSFSMGGEWFDIGGHVSFAKDKRVRDLLEDGVTYTERLADALNYKNGKWIVHPVQNNLFVLDSEEKIRIIEDYISKPNIDSPANYAEWLISKYGKYFAENYPTTYTRKYWTVEPAMLETKWVGKRMYETSLHELLYGAFEKKTKNVHYSNGVRYPVSGGFESFIKKIEEGSKTQCEVDILSINVKDKIIKTKDGIEYKYNVLINTAPLPSIINLIEFAPEKIKNCCEKLYCTSLVLVSMCVKGSFNHDYPAFYIYDEDILPSRVFSTNQYSKTKTGRRAIQAEVYYSQFKPLNNDVEFIKRKTVSQLIELKVFEEKDLESVDVKIIPFANIIFTPEIYDSRSTVIEYLKSNGIYCAGRFGLWDYLWSDQTIISAIDIVDEITKVIH